jgi:hypothetical protein
MPTLMMMAILMTTMLILADADHIDMDDADPC